jgi:hypothetical protein
VAQIPVAYCPQAIETPQTRADATQKTTPKNDPLTEVLVKIGSKKVADVKV